MVKEINLNNLNALCRGTSFLGSGGGGDIDELCPIVKKALSLWGPVPIISLGDLEEEDIIVAIEMIGAPVPLEMRNENLRIRIKPVLDLAMQDLGKPIKALMPVEIGGANALTPLCVAGEVGLPLLDGDLLGRAFPEISMISTNAFDMIPRRVYIGDPETGIARVMTCESYPDLEQKGRVQAGSHQSSAAILIPVVLSGQEAQEVVIPGSMSQSVLIGEQKSLEDLCQVVSGKIQLEGKVTHWDYEVRGGFLYGKVMIQTQQGDVYQVIVKNEYMRLCDYTGKVIVEAPDIISLLQSDSLMPILSDQICIGDRVICVTCRGPELWYSDQGMPLIQGWDKNMG